MSFTKVIAALSRTTVITFDDSLHVLLAKADSKMIYAYKQHAKLIGSFVEHCYFDRINDGTLQGYLNASIKNLNDSLERNHLSPDDKRKRIGKRDFEQDVSALLLSIERIQNGKSTCVEIIDSARSIDLCVSGLVSGDYMNGTEIDLVRFLKENCFAQKTFSRFCELPFWEDEFIRSLREQYQPSNVDALYTMFVDFDAFVERWSGQARIADAFLELKKEINLMDGAEVFHYGFENVIDSFKDISAQFMDTKHVLFADAAAILLRNNLATI